MDYSTYLIYQDVMDKLQAAEALGGPVGQEYVNLMSSIAAVCTMRAHNAAAEQEAQAQRCTVNDSSRTAWAWCKVCGKKYCRCDERSDAPAAL